MHHQTKKKLQIAGKKTLAAGRMVLGTSKIAGAASSYALLSTTMGPLEYAFRRALIQNSCNKGLETIKSGAKDWEAAGTLWQVDLPDKEEIKQLLDKVNPF